MIRQKEIRPVAKKEARAFAVTVLEKIYNTKVNSVKYIGGGSFGFVFKADIDKKPFKVIMKACRTKGICEREANDLTLLGSDSIIKIPKVYFTFLATEKCDIKTAFYALYHEVYAYITSGTKVNFILMPLVKRMNKELNNLYSKALSVFYNTTISSFSFTVPPLRTLPKMPSFGIIH